MATWFYHRTLPPRLVAGGSPPGAGWADTPAAFYEPAPDPPLAAEPVAPSPTAAPVEPPKRRGRPPLDKKK